jgi:hypothetical protein
MYNTESPPFQVLMTNISTWPLKEGGILPVTFVQGWPQSVTFTAEWPQSAHCIEVRQGVGG